MDESGDGAAIQTPVLLLHAAALPTPERKTDARARERPPVGRASNACPDLATDYLKTRQQDTHCAAGNGRVLFKSEPAVSALLNAIQVPFRVSELCSGA